MTDSPPPEDPRDALIREQAERTGAQAERIAVLEAMVADLRERLGAEERAGSRNSGNSSMPPGSDDLPGRKVPRKQRRAAERAEEKKRNRGKQPGSPGAAMRWEVPDRPGTITRWGNARVAGTWRTPLTWGFARSYQQEEIPAAAAERVQHDLHEAERACGRVHAAARPAGVPDSALPTGPRPRAWPFTWWCSSMCRWSGAGNWSATSPAPSCPRSSSTRAWRRRQSWPRTWSG